MRLKDMITGMDAWMDAHGHSITYQCRVHAELLFELRNVRSAQRSAMHFVMTRSHTAEANDCADLCASPPQTTAD